MKRDLTADDVDLTIDIEFKETLGPLHKDELAALKSSVEEKGEFEEPIWFWGPEKKIADGHHRYDIWMALPDDTPIPPPEVRELLKPDRASVIAWIKKRQGGRRNVSGKARTALLALAQKSRKKKVGKPHASTSSDVKSDENSRKVNGVTVTPLETDGVTASKIAAEHGVSTSTVYRASAYEEALSAIGKVNGKAKTDIENEVLKLSKKVVTEIGKLDHDGIARALGNIRNGRKWNHVEPSTNGKPAVASIVKDGLERTVPEDLREPHDLAAKITSVANSLDNVKKEVRKLAEQAGGEFIPLQQIEDALKDTKGLIAQSRYYTDCPRCKGKPKPKCDRCDGAGFIPFSRKGQLSDEDKKYLGVA